MFSAICLCSAAFAQASLSAPSEKPTPAVTVPFFVDPGHGNQPTEISIEDLSILDDKKAPKGGVALHTAKAAPLRVGLLLDNSGSQRDSDLYPQVATAAFGFLGDVLIDPDAKVLVAGFAKDAGATKFMRKAEFQSLKFTLALHGRTALYDAINLCTERMSEDSVLPSRRILVLLSDGDDNVSHANLSKAITAAENTGTVIFAISTGDRYTADDRDVASVLEELASATGGLAFTGLSRHDLPKTFATIRARIDHMYSLTYVPAESATPRHFHSVELRITSDRKRKVHAPRGYVPAG